VIVIPAVDLREGACVQLVGGSYAEERVRLDDPVAVAAHWRELGFRRQHIVDLDAATGRGSNASIIDRILSDNPGKLQIGGGIRATERVDALVRAGAQHVVLGTKAIECPQWAVDVAARYPDRIIVAADVRGRQLVTRGWAHEMSTDIFALVSTLSSLPLAGLLVTAVHVEGQMRGPDLDLVRDLVARTSVPIIASGGVGNIMDLRALADCGAAGTVIGMALYTGAVDPGAVAQEFSS
jgi:phosphoribosylformimino-5-aminoimidazole carboxamide ribotide isomerase